MALRYATEKYPELKNDIESLKEIISVYMDGYNRAVKDANYED